MTYVPFIQGNMKGMKTIYTTRATSRIIDGSYNSIYKGRSMNFDELREYVAGDDIKDVDWNAYPQYYHSIDRKIYTYKFRKACENADKIIAISECTKRDIIEFFRIPADKIEVVYQGCDPSFIHPVAEEKKKRSPG